MGVSVDTMSPADIEIMASPDDLEKLLKLVSETKVPLKAVPWTVDDNAAVSRHKRFSARGW